MRLSPTLVHPDLATGGRLQVDHAFADRADILGANGSRLVTERPVLRFGIDKTTIAKPEQAAAARELAKRLDIDPKAFAARVAAAGDKAFVEALVLRPADARPFQADGTAALPGVSVVRDTLPLAPTRDFARAVLGTVGPVDAELVKKSGGVYQAGDDAGLSGLESRYDEQLRGTPGTTVSAVDAKGGSRELFTVDPSAGTALRTTLDPRLQRAAEQALAATKPASAVVAIRPSTGDLLAVANGEGSQGYATATLGQYAPGSTFKVVSSLALLRAGLTASTPVDCPATTVVTGKRFKNYSDYPADGLGRITLGTAVANSCNTAFIGQRDKVSQGDLAGAAASLGLGVDHDLGFPAYFGSVPRTDAEAGSATGHAASMIGQGKVVASPMAMAAVAASVARGSTVVPRLLPAQKTDDGTSDDTASTPLKASEAAAAAVADARRGHPRQRGVPGLAARRAGAGQDRHRGVRGPAAAADPHLDDRRARRPRGRGLRRRRGVRVADRRPDPRAVPARRRLGVIGRFRGLATCGTLRTGADPRVSRSSAPGCRRRACRASPAWSATG